jgi:hypothetical protein
MAGWPRLEPANPTAEPAAVAWLLRLGFVLDGTDWVWRRAFLPELVPVAAHAAGRALAEAWALTGKKADRLLDVKRLDLADVLLRAAGDRCGRCIGEVCEEH